MYHRSHVNNRTVSLETMLRFPPLHLVMEHEALAASYLLKVRSGRWDHDHKHSGEHLSKKDSVTLLKPHSDKTTREYDFMKPYKIIIANKTAYRQK